LIDEDEKHRTGPLPVVALAIVVLLQAQPAGADAGGSTCTTGPILSSRIEGCDTPRCLLPGFTDAVLELGDLSEGNTLDQATLKAARDRIERLGFFRTINLECEAGQGGVEVVLRVVPRKHLDKIRVNGQRHFHESDLVDRLALRRGDCLDPEDPGTADILKRVRDFIKRDFMEAGFQGTTVKTKMVPAEDGLVDLDIQVEEGKSLKLSSIKASLAPASESGPSHDALPEWSCPDVSRRDIRRWSGLSVGDPYSDRTNSNVARRLKRALRAIGFSGIKVRSGFDPDTQGYEINATYDSCYLIRFFTRDMKRPGRLGFAQLSDENLLNTLPFADSGVFDMTEASIGRKEIRRFFLDRGYLLNDVVLDYRRVVEGSTDSAGQETGPGVAGVISYFVTMNGRKEIRGIRFLGIDGLTSDVIQEVMNTKPYDFFGDPGSLLPDQVSFDLEKIRDLYRRNGFSHMRFGWTNPEAGGVESSRDGPDRLLTYRDRDMAFRARLLPNTDGIYLEINIIEGERDTIGNLAVEGAVSIPMAEVLASLGLKSGGPFSKAVVVEALRRLTRLYSNEGYLAAGIGLACRGHEPEVPEGECIIEDLDSRVVDLAFTIDEGRQTTVRSVFVDGSIRTLDSTILFGFPSRGDPYRVGEVAEAVKELKNLGIFSSIHVDAIGADEDPPSDRVAIVVTCREDRTRFVDIAVGFEDLDRSGEFPAAAGSVVSTSIAMEDRSSTGFGKNVGLKIPDILLSAEVRYTDMNFLGRGKRLYVPIKYGLSSTAWDRYAAFTPSYVDPRFFARGLTFRFTPFVIYDRATTRLDLFEFGAELAISKELAPHLHGSLTYEIAEVTSRDPAVTSKYSPFRLENKLRPTITYDRLDHPINPKKGGLLQASLSYINALVSGDTDNYLKFQVSGKFFWTLRDILTFGLFARFGTSRSFGGSVRLPDEERFTLGGNRGVRGFANDGVAQYHSDGSLRLDRSEDGKLVKPRGGDHMIAGSFEIRFPILRQISLHGAIFYDFGALSDHLSEFTGASFRHSAGVGIRFLIADTVPLRLDYGVILDRRCGDVDPQTGLCVQKEEIGNIHFGLLYTF